MDERNSHSISLPALLFLISFLAWGCTATTVKTHRPADVGIAKQKRVDKNRFGRFTPGSYHNVIVLKFINPVPVRIIETPAVHRRSGPDVAAPRQKRLVYLPGERTPEDIDAMKREKIDGNLVQKELEAIGEILGREGIEFRRYFSRRSGSLRDERLQVRMLSGTEAPDLNNYYNIFVRDASVAEEIIGRLNGFRIVEVAYFPPIPSGADIPPTTPDLAGNQQYLDPAPNGIDARAAWAVPGGNGTNVRIIDIEGDWVLDHEDMVQPFLVDIRPALMSAANLLDPAESLNGRNHGTAVIGILRARDDGRGVTGIAHGSRYGVVSVIRESMPEIDPSIFYRMTADAINVAAANLDPGDVILIEQHAPFHPDISAPVLCICNCGQSEYVAVENWQAEYDAIFSATARGVIVVEAAGNGSMNLDSPLYGGRFDPAVRDSGAIMVGASEVESGTTPSGALSLTTNHEPACFSNYGSRVDVHAWGGGIWSLGYGDGESNNGADERQWYTGSFGGTSGASAIVAGAVAAIQGTRIAAGRTPLGPADMRRLLVATGTPQAGTGHIGPQPDLSSALGDLGGNPVEDYGPCTLPAEHSSECGGAACVRKKVCYEVCSFLGLFCEQECLLSIPAAYECVNR